MSAHLFVKIISKYSLSFPTLIITIGNPPGFVKYCKEMIGRMLGHPDHPVKAIQKEVNTSNYSDCFSALPNRSLLFMSLSRQQPKGVYLN